MIARFSASNCSFEVFQLLYQFRIFCNVGRLSPCEQNLLTFYEKRYNENFLLPYLVNALLVRKVKRLLMQAFWYKYFTSLYPLFVRQYATVKVHLVLCADAKWLVLRAYFVFCIAVQQNLKQSKKYSETAKNLVSFKRHFLSCLSKAKTRK